ncbi:hypothetical protein [Marinobacter nauticus]|uniref:Vanillate O-demethylase oxygenase-like C-terminal catalytic domain-containing protein n=1 Tax=Marinobacter nauticus TaxID=2743 RepID=A0A1M2URX4_MARNT|nr:hypothetical protein [Marinobacter nauticus]OJS98056.1 hypothetical protein BEE62_17270 [Marinobacter nauticus]
MSLDNEQWYAAGWAEELDAGPLTRRIAGRMITVERLSSRRVLAWSGDTEKVRIVLKNRLIWVKFGWALEGEQSEIPDFDCLDLTNDYTFTEGGVNWLDVSCDLFLNNLLDLQNFEKERPQSLFSGVAKLKPLSARYEAGRLRIDCLSSRSTPDFLFIITRAVRSDNPVDYWANVRFETASNMFVDSGISAPDEPRSTGKRLSSVHIVVPETERSCWYFWMFFRDYSKDAEELTSLLERSYQKTILFRAEMLKDRFSDSTDHLDYVDAIQA